MEFAEVIGKLALGKRMRRRKWNRTSFIFTDIGGNYLRFYYCANDNMDTSGNYPYNPTVEDFIADDWEEYVAPVFDFIEAVNRLEKGKKVRRKEWYENTYIEMVGGSYIKYSGKRFEFSGPRVFQEGEKPEEYIYASELTDTDRKAFSYWFPNLEDVKAGDWKEYDDQT